MKAAPLLLDLLAACPRLKLLVTSRETLRVLGDRFAEELYFWGGAPVATRRGYHVLLIDQPGQGITPFDGLYTRADAEVPVRAMVDYLCSRQEGEPSRPWHPSQSFCNTTLTKCSHTHVCTLGKGRT